MCPKSQMNCGKKGRCENGDRLLMSMLFCPTAIDNDCVQIAFPFHLRKSYEHFSFKLAPARRWYYPRH